jgi:hypothetical protein
MTVGVNEELALVEWLAGSPESDGENGYLASDSTLWGLVNGIYDDMSGAGEDPTPLVRITHQDAYDARPNGTDRALTTVELLIRGITKGADRTLALQISSALDNLLNTNQTIETPTLMVCGVGRLEPFWQREWGDSKFYLHAGGIYSFAVHAL